MGWGSVVAAVGRLVRDRVGRRATLVDETGGGIGQDAISLVVGGVLKNVFFEDLLLLLGQHGLRPVGSVRHIRLRLERVEASPRGFLVVYVVLRHGLRRQVRALDVLLLNHLAQLGLLQHLLVIQPNG